MFSILLEHITYTLEVNGSDLVLWEGSHYHEDLKLAFVIPGDKLQNFREQILLKDNGEHFYKVLMSDKKRAFSIYETMKKTTLMDSFLDIMSIDDLFVAQRELMGQERDTNMSPADLFDMLGDKFTGVSDSSVFDAGHHMDSEDSLQGIVGDIQDKTEKENRTIVNKKVTQAEPVEDIITSDEVWDVITMLETVDREVTFNAIIKGLKYLAENKRLDVLTELLYRIVEEIS
jgi:hypothetical protein